jgi:hypothetical protein
MRVSESCEKQRKPHKIQKSNNAAPLITIMTIEDSIYYSTAAAPTTSSCTKNWRYYHDVMTFQVSMAISPCAFLRHNQTIICFSEVEDQLFRESTRYFVIHSKFFQELLITISGDPDQVGNSDDNPLKLEGVRANEFELLLSLVYPMYVRLLSPSSIWIPVNLLQKPFPRSRFFA